MNETLKKKLYHRKYIIAATVFLLISGALFVSFLKWEPKPDPASDKIIREAAAEQLGKDPNELTDEDFARIEVLNLSNSKIINISLLDKFVNLRELNIPFNFPFIKKIPEWKKFLAKYGVIDIPTLQSRQIISGHGSGDEEICLMDLSPLKKLHNLQKIELLLIQLDNVKPLAGLTNLKRLGLEYTGISDIEPLKGLKNLETLNLDYNPITDLKPLKNLTQLKSLYIRHCDKITKEQVEDLQKALPNLKILYGPGQFEQVLTTGPPE
ncbi:MAG: leucine-rich repeat domain-containing protein [Sedimentisphaerales bacterium]|nr:leucine-rich repeat domain-containing protein [Sedimentisphaerales bacterium]